jgi:predicted nucleic acid-binding protein
VKPQQIARHYVVDTNTAILGSLPPELLTADTTAVAAASALFLSRAAVHGAALHVPHLFFSEVANAIYRDAIGAGLLTFENGLILLEDVLSPTWTAHTPVWDRVYALQRALQRTRSTGDAEFLSIAETLGYEVITADEKLVKAAAQNQVGIAVVFVTDHPWASPGSLEDFPPTD